MQRSEILHDLKDYIAHTVLDGKDIGLDETTPLLEWGVINSIEIVRLANFIQNQFHVAIPPHKFVGDRFADLASITDLVCETIQEHSIAG